MSPSIVGQAEFDALVAAVQPSDGELLEVKHQLIQQLSDGDARPVSELNACVLAAFGVPPQEHRQQHYDVPRDVRGAEAIDPDAVPIKRQRLMYAVKLVTAELVADGLIVPAEQRGNDYLTVPIHRSGTSGGERVPVSSPRLEGPYRMTPGRSQFLEPVLLDASQFLRGVPDLLDERGERCLDEALRAARRGLYLSAVNLLGVVSESAWYAVGRMFEAEDQDLAKAIAENRTAQVQRLVGNKLENVRAKRTAVTELRAHAAYLRDLRNYGVHPVEDRDPGQEQAFTEPGCLLLVMQTHRYLARLAEVVEAARAHDAK